MSNSTAWGSELGSLQDIQELSIKYAASKKNAWSVTSFRIMKMIRKGLWDDIVDFELDPGIFSTSEEYALCAQLLAFFQKVQDLPIKRDRKAVAWKKFVESEQNCKNVNETFRLLDSGALQLRRGVDELLFAAQRKISRVLGDVPRISDLKFRLGGGAVRQIPKRTAVPSVKLGHAPNCSANCVNLASAVLAELPLYAGLHATSEDSDSWIVPLMVTRGKISFVPKNAKVDRIVVTEPSLNAMIQLSIGDYMFDRLKRVGLDLRDQTLNQRRAREGSLTNALATLDLSSASDSISVELVRHLLPYDWFSLLADARTPTVVAQDGSIVVLEKFSSMGNGYTFPLETLIFWALSSAVCEDEREVTVYGDDIILPSCHYDAVVELLWFCGFKVNPTKSFKQGPFRESCGKDYYLGIDVRPLFLKTTRLTYLDMCLIHNFWVRSYEDELARWVLEKVPDPYRLFGPDGFGDGHLVRRDFTGEAVKRKKGWGGRVFATLMRTTEKIVVNPKVAQILPVYHIYMRSDFEPIEPCLELRRKGEDRDKAARLELAPQLRGYKVVSIYYFG